MNKYWMIIAPNLYDKLKNDDILSYCEYDIFKIILLLHWLFFVIYKLSLSSH